MDKIRALRFFVAVTDTGSFVGAAKVFGTSPSTVSKAIGRLEDSLNVPLFARSTRTLKLTHEGRHYLASVKALLLELDNVESHLRNNTQHVQGHLKINVPVSYGRLYIRPLLKSFCAHYPDVDIEIIYDDAYVDMIENGIDLTIRSGALADNRLVARKLSPIDFLVCAPYAYDTDSLTEAEIKEAESISAEWMNAKWIMFRFKQTGRLMPISLPTATGIQAYYPPNRIVVDDGEALAELCADGLGLAQMPHFIARNTLLSRKIRPLLPATYSEQLGVYAVYPKRQETPAKISAFIRFLQDQLAHKGEFPERTWARELEIKYNTPNTAPP